VPERPAWHCKVCGDDVAWPCEPAWEKLTAQYGADRVSLAVYMVGQMHTAIGDLPSLSPAYLYDRFIRRTRPGTADAHDPGA
jgi:hypothetical protein